MGLVHLRSELRRSFPWSLELIVTQKCLFENFAMIGANGKQASVSEHGVGRLR